jgi:NAD(P)-dependent dehydrogenase (short-subunit alcohol dehydrogenase family)
MSRPVQHVAAGEGTMRYEGKRVVVIGGTSGIGFATARHFLEEGARVVVTGRMEAGLQTASAKLGNAVVIRSDASSLPEIRALPARIEENLGGIDLLFVNAGVNVSGSFEGTSEEVYDQSFAVNAKGPYFTVQTLAPLIVNGGAIVFTTSVANVRGLPGAGVYAATKAALRSMVRSFARELLARNIRVNAVSPGPIDTHILAKSLGEAAAEKARAQFRDANPMKRFGNPEEIARAVAFLAFDASYTTGAELPVDGGASQL